jgi:Ser/Thr protein kinase RdoA (MazF antagonist)
LGPTIQDWLESCGLPPDGWMRVSRQAAHLVMTHSESRVFLKQLRHLAQYRRERDALRALNGSLSGIPLLLHHHDQLRALLMVACEGVPVAATPGDDHPVWERAGAWLARLHSLKPLPPLVAVDEVPLHTAVEWRKTRLMLELAQHPNQDLAGRFANALQKVPWPASCNIRVPCHRDFEPRNWLWCPDDSLLSVVDFEHVRADAAAFDLVKVLEACGSANSDSWRHFIGAYEAAGGTCPPDDAIRCAFGHHSAFTWAWGERHRDAEWIRRGFGMLVRIENAPIARR